MSTKRKVLKNKDELGKFVGAPKNKSGAKKKHPCNTPAMRKKWENRCLQCGKPKGECIHYWGPR